MRSASREATRIPSARASGFPARGSSDARSGRRPCRGDASRKPSASCLGFLGGPPPALDGPPSRRAANSDAPKFGGCHLFLLTESVETDTLRRLTSSRLPSVVTTVTRHGSSRFPWGKNLACLSGDSPSHSIRLIDWFMKTVRCGTGTLSAGPSSPGARVRQNNAARPATAAITMTGARSRFMVPDCSRR
jgi:hypothetical protein